VFRRDPDAPPRHLLVAVGDDRSQGSALAFAADLALRQGSGIRLVHVVPAARDSGPDLLPTFEATLQVAQGILQQARSRLRSATDDQVDIEVLVRRGHVPDVLEELAEDADVVVLEHRQQPRLRRVLSGSVAAEVAARATVPVVSVPEYWTSWRTGGSHVTVGVQTGVGDRPVLDEAFAAASCLEATLTVLHAWPLPQAHAAAAADRRALASWRMSICDQIREQLDPWVASHPKVDVRVDIVRMRPADALVNASRHSDLLVTGRSGNPQGRHRLGSSARALIRESLCPVMVVPNLVGADAG
jgi:nucleotide-binding universal stress UspA family protein